MGYITLVGGFSSPSFNFYGIYPKMYLGNFLCMYIKRCFLTYPRGIFLQKYITQIKFTKSKSLSCVQGFYKSLMTFHRVRQDC